MTWKAVYEPWTAVDIEPIPVPWAQELGVPISHVQLPGPVAAASAEALIEVCQALAYVRVCQAADLMLADRDALRRRRTTLHFSAAAHAHYEPGLVRLVCPQCGDGRDARVGDDGLLEEPRTLICRDGHEAAVRIEVQDGTT